MFDMMVGMLELWQLIVILQKLHSAAFEKNTVDHYGFDISTVKQTYTKNVIDNYKTPSRERERLVGLFGEQLILSLRS
jgi:hypothetical protein